MRSPRIVLVIALVVSAGVSTLAAPTTTAYASDDTYRTRGVVKGFGPDRKTINIEHEKIDGYMEAMMMSFEPRTAKQLDGLAAGDTVKFSFTETEGGHRMINTIEKVSASR